MDSKDSVPHEDTEPTETLQQYVEAIRQAHNEREARAMMVYCPGEIRCIVLEPNKPQVIGRGRQVNVRIDDRSVSAEHARLTLIDNEIQVEDLQSTNGIKRGNERIQGSCTLTVGEHLVLGERVILHAIRCMFESVPRLANSTAPVLIQGETGVGKEELARAIHAAGKRCHQAFVSVNCGRIPKDIIKSELFGHERGAFTGATQQHQGFFEVARDSTIFLDEIADLPLEEQATLLHVLNGERMQITRVGSNKVIDVDVRVITATNKDLKTMIRDKKFREEFYYRISTLREEIAPLRDRVEDIEPLALHALHRANHKENASVRGISLDAMALLKGYAWPGNIRELKSVIHQAVLRTKFNEITVNDLPDEVRGSQSLPQCSSIPGGSGATLQPPSNGAKGQHNAVAKAIAGPREKEYYIQVLGECDTQAKAAKRLGVGLKTLQRRMKALGIRPTDYKKK